MSILADMAFGAMGHFIREEAEKLIVKNINETTVNSLLNGLGVKISELSSVRGNVKVNITDIQIGYTGTAMKETRMQNILLPDKTIPMIIEQKYAEPEKKGPAGKIDFSCTVNIRNIGFSKSVGPVKAEINTVTFHMTAEGSAETELV